MGKPFGGKLECLGEKLPPPSRLNSDMSDCSVQCAIGSRNREMTVANTYVNVFILHTQYQWHAMSMSLQWLVWANKAPK